MEEAPAADKNSTSININDPKKIQDDNFKLAIDYYSKDNPFNKVIIGSTIGVVGSFSSAIIALGVSGAYISGGILFYDTAFLVGGYATIAGAAGIVVGIPAILGGVGYAIYKAVKTKKLKNYMKKITNKKDESAEEEREILQLLTQECLRYFNEFLKNSFTIKLKDLIEEETSDIIKIIRNLKQTDDDGQKEKMLNEINEMKFINIVLIGSTGVGKSTLINEFLKLKNNKAKEGDTAEPQKIGEGWPKKYPVSEDDTDIKGINLYDTEGIEKTGENGFNNHLSAIVNFIHSPEKDLKNKINAIWYCINSNRLDGDEEYINKIFDLFSSIKIPIIFIFTKAYSSREEDIYMIEEGLKKFKHFQEHPEEFHFIEVIAKDYISKKTGKVTETKKGLDELLTETQKLSKNTIMAPIIKKISDSYNLSSREIIKRLSDLLQEQYNQIVLKHDKYKTFDQKLLDIFKLIYGDFKASTEEFISVKIKGWMKKLEEMKKDELKQALKNYDKKYLMNKIEITLKQKYDEKVKKNEQLPKEEQFTQKYEEFKEDINDYLITQLNNAKEFYGLYTLFDLARDSILGPILKDLERDLNIRKLNMTKELQDVILKKIEKLSQTIMA